MVDIAGSYDPNAEISSFDPVPPGEYRAKIIEGDIQPISKRENKGRCLVLTWQIETGNCDGRLVWQRLNLYAENMKNLDKVINIANSQFAEIRQATGVLAPKNTNEIEHIPCTIRVVFVNNDQYGPKNEVKRVMPIGGATTQPVPARPNTAATQQRAPVNNGGDSAPWNTGA
ncbi:DUF669 domain-containing protein [Brucella sp. IR073]|uniref:DUF669 domain-containing protein n=1 Tax=unclassified Brucella TaxID=2632610 RepID=UPI003B97FD18